LSCGLASYNQFGTRLQRAAGGARLPLSGSFELTFKCNLRCVHCYIPDFSGRGELSSDEVRRILSEAADEGCLWMLLTGGEVLSRPDFADIYVHAKRLGQIVTVFTNGTLLEERHADLFAEYPPFSLEITLYGMSDATYESTTGIPGRFARVRRAVERLVERRVRLTLKAVALKTLRDELPAMRAWADSLGVPFRYDGAIHGRLDGSLQPLAARAAPRDLVALDAADPERYAHWKRFYDQFLGSTPKDGALLSCGAGLQSFHVDPRGMLWSCEALPLDGYDLRRGSFRDGWYGPVARVRERRAAAANVCTACDLKSLCDRCPATAILETGSPDGWIPHFCETTHRRAALLEDRDPERRSRYLRHADQVASGWTPPGAILPRASRLDAHASGAPACSSGGCGTGCAKGSRPADAQPIVIALPTRTETVR
jgi:radical SAM protein with 4Fe4S-binding SPASM domain